MFWYDGNILRTRSAGDISDNYFFLTAKHMQACPSACAAAAVLTSATGPGRTDGTPPRRPPVTLGFL